MGNKLNARVTHMHDVEANWQKCKTFVPELAEPIVYDPDAVYPYTRLKIGDGKTKINELPFISIDKYQLAEQLGIVWVDDIGYIDSGRISSTK